MLEHVPSGYQAVPATASFNTSVELQSNSGFVFTFDALRPGLFRTTFTSPKHLLPPHRATPVPSKTLDDTTAAQVSSSTTSKAFAVDGVTANVDWEGGVPIVSLTLPGQKTPIHTDLPNRSYVADGPGVSHYTRYNNGTLHLGLGEKPAPMDLSNRHFVLSATDSFGYDVYRTDPLYKHIPLLINCTPDGCVGIFSTSHARGFYSVRDTAVHLHLRRMLTSFTRSALRWMGCGDASKYIVKITAASRSTSWWERHYRILCASTLTSLAIHFWCRGGHSVTWLVV